MSLPYGFMSASDGHIAIDQEKANTVRTIYQQYLSGMSLKGITDSLFVQGIPPPRSRTKWTQAVINGLLSNRKYIGSIISFDEFFIAQREKGNRSSLDEHPSEKDHPALLAERTGRPFSLWEMQARLSDTKRLLVCGVIQIHIKKLREQQYYVLLICCHITVRPPFCAYGSLLFSARYSYTIQE